MFSSLTSILPSGFSFSRLEKEREQRESERERESNERAQDSEEITPRAGEMKESAAVDEHGVKKRRERNPNEVRPAFLRLPR